MSLHALMPHHCAVLAPAAAQPKHLAQPFKRHDMIVLAHISGAVFVCTFTQPKHSAQ